MAKNNINTRSFRRHPNFDKQIGAMKSRFPQFQAVQKNGKLFFVGVLQVRKNLPEYKVKIEYRGSLHPCVSVVSPKLVDNPPHIYPKSRHLCLFRPDLYKWSADKLVAKDIVPWTAAWIYFYEYWLRTGVWMGPEAPHIMDKEEDTK